ncbi:MAG: InlB B-repeat-containing protein [Clostridiales bacterium]|jgi:hypothetical protein|nr:InlB B-repeat-containing protein [Clostridiales bacterium]
MQTFKRKLVGISVLFAFFLLALVAVGSSSLKIKPSAAPGQTLSGTGTDADPYLVASAADMAALNSYLGPNYQGKIFKLTQDISLTAYPDNWKPIGGVADDDLGNPTILHTYGEAVTIDPDTGLDLVTYAFYGVFDGNGHTVSGLTIYRPSVEYQGLFGNIRNATVKNLGLVQKDGMSGYVYGGNTSGGLVAYMFNSTVTSCYNHMNVGTQRNQFRVTFVPGNNTLDGGMIAPGEEPLRVQDIDDGFNAIPPNVIRRGYHLDADNGYNGWSGSYTHIYSTRTLYAVWELDIYTVTFNMNGGTYTGTVPLRQDLTIVDYNANRGAIEPTPHPTRDGYIFQGWDTDFSLVESSFEVKAIWELERYDVNFYDGSTLIKTQNVVRGDSATPPNPTKVGYNFVGWSGDYTNVTSNRDVYAQWEIKKYTVRFYNEGAVVKTQTNVPHGTAATAPDPSTLDKKSVWQFLRWSVPFDTVTSDLSVHAVWYKDPGGIAGVAHSSTVSRCYNTGTINGEIAGGIVGTLRENSNVIDCYNAGSVIGVKANSVVGGIVGAIESGTVTNAYNVGGISGVTGAEASNSSFGAIAGRQDQSLGVFNGNVFYNTDTKAEAVYGVAGVSSTAAMGKTTAELKTKTTFNAFDFINTWYINDGQHYPLLRGLGGQTNKVSYLVTFSGNGGTRTGGGAESQQVYEGDSATAPIYVFAGKSQTGWTRSDRQGITNDLTNITQDTTIAAAWGQNTYTVQFVIPNDAVRTGGGQLLQFVEHNHAAELPIVSRPGYTHTGWDNMNLTYITSNMTVNATWAINTYTVTFNLNGGSSNGGGAASQTVPHQAAAVAPTGLSKNGHTFVGWDKDFSHVTQNLEVNALWNPLNVTVTFNSGGFGTKTGGGLEVQTIPYGGSITNPPTYESVSHIQIGWGGKSLTNITESCTITAEWRYKQYTVQFSANGGTIPEDQRHLLTQIIDHGFGAVAPAFVREGYTLTWDKDFSQVTQNLEVTAQWTIKTFTVTFDLDDGTVVWNSPEKRLVQSVTFGQAATAPIVSKLGYTFIEWNTAFNDVRSNLTVKARWQLATPEVDETIEHTGDTKILRVNITPKLSYATYTYQWEEKNNGVWETLRGKTTNELIISINANESNYRCLIRVDDNRGQVLPSVPGGTTYTPYGGGTGGNQSAGGSSQAGGGSYNVSNTQTGGLTAKTWRLIWILLALIATAIFIILVLWSSIRHARRERDYYHYD